MKSLTTALITVSVVIFALLVLSGCASTTSYKDESIFGGQQQAQAPKMRVVVIEEKPAPMSVGGKIVPQSVLEVMAANAPKPPLTPEERVEWSRNEGKKVREEADQKEREIVAYCEESRGLNCPQQQKAGWRPPNPAGSVGSILLGSWIASSSTNIYGRTGGVGGVSYWLPGLGVLAIYPLTRLMMGVW